MRSLEQSIGLIYEQADGSPETPRYQWILEAPYRFRKYLPFWRWTRGEGRRGVYVTKEATIALAMASRYGRVIRSNGTHAPMGIPLSGAARISGNEE